MRADGLSSGPTILHCHVAGVALKGQNGLRVHYVFYQTLELQPSKKNCPTQKLKKKEYKKFVVSGLQEVCQKFFNLR